MYSIKINPKSAFHFMADYEYECIVTVIKSGRTYTGYGNTEEEAKREALEKADANKWLES